MNRASELCELLNQKKALFEEYEAETLRLTAGSVEGISERLDRRALLREKIDELTQRLGELCPSDELLKKAMRLDCARGELPEEARRVFDAALEVQAVLQRILQEDGLAVARVTEERDAAADRLRALNSGKEAAAARYLKSSRPYQEQGDRGKI